MVFTELEPRRQAEIESVNSFLEKTWGIGSYTDLAPAALLQRNPRTQETQAYPLLLLEVARDRSWEAQIIGVDPASVKFYAPRSGELSMAVRRVPDTDEQQWDLQGLYSSQKRLWTGRFTSKTPLAPVTSGEAPESKWVAIKGEGHLYDVFQPGRLVSFFETFVGGYRLVSSIRKADGRGRYFGFISDPYSGSWRELYVADFRRADHGFDKKEQFRVGRWLVGALSEGEAFPGNRRRDQASQAS